jgi:hypothetical protein
MSDAPERLLLRLLRGLRLLRFLGFLALPIAIAHGHSSRMSGGELMLVAPPLQTLVVVIPP